MIRPRRSRIMPLLARRAQRKDPARLVSTTVSQSSSLIRMRSPSLVTPALATSTSTGPPSFSSASVNAASTEAVSVTSQRTPMSPSGASPERCVTATVSPASANDRAIARPMPRLPPVTRTVRGSLMPSNLVDYRWVAGAGRHTVDACP